MTRYPHAYCEQCDRILSPSGSMKAARDAKRKHEEMGRKFLGGMHDVAIRERDTEEHARQ